MWPEITASLFWRRRTLRKLCLLVVPVMLFAAVSVVPSVSAKSSKITLHATLSGKNEVGSKAPRAGSGSATITITMSTGKLCYSLKVSGFRLPATAAHIHSGRAGKNGPVSVPFASAPGSNGRSVGCTTVKAPMLKGIAAHPTSYYVNVHSAAYPAGAVRGQLGM